MSTQTTPPTPANHFNLFRWDNTECLLQTEVIAPKWPLPASATHPNSLLVDCKESKANDLQIVEYFKDVLIGVNPRPDLQFLQLFFASESIAKDILDKGPHRIDNHILPLYPPRGILPKRILMKLANVPIGPKEETLSALRDVLSPTTCIIDGAPLTYKVKGTSIMTTRWNLVVETAYDNPNFAQTPVAFEVLGQTVLASWPGSPPSCLTCLAAGHNSANCPHPKRRPHPTHYTHMQMQ